MNWHEWRSKQIDNAVHFYAQHFPKYSQREVADMFRISQAGFSDGWNCFKRKNGITWIMGYGF